MQAKEKSSILLSIFRRKGAEGLMTKIIDDNNKAQYKPLFDSLNGNEKPLIIYYESELNWFILTSSRIIMKMNGYTSNILNTDLIEVRPAIQEEFKDKIINKNNFTRLYLKDTNLKDYILKMEMGEPYEGLYQVLHFIASNNNK